MLSDGPSSPHCPVHVYTLSSLGVHTPVSVMHVHVRLVTNWTIMPYPDRSIGTRDVYIHMCICTATGNQCVCILRSMSFSIF